MLDETALINELGQIVPARGNPLSPARIRAQFPQTLDALLRYLRSKIDKEHRRLHAAPADRRGLDDYFQEFMRTNFPERDLEVHSAFWRTVVCEQDIFDFITKNQ